jgi:titin
MRFRPDCALIVIAALAVIAGCAAPAPSPPDVQVTSPVADVTVNEGAAAVFRIVVTTTAQFVVEWRRDNVIIEARGGTTLTVASATAADHNAVFAARVVAGTTNPTTVEAGSGRLLVTLTPPAAPTGFAATVTSSRTMDFTWIDNATNETGFELARVAGETETSMRVPANQTSVTLTDLTPAFTHVFRLRAFRVVDTRSVHSAPVEVAATTPPDALAPAAPSNARLLSTSVSGSMVFAWDDNSNNEDGFQIFRVLNGVDEFVGTLFANQTQLDIRGLTPGTTVTFRVRAIRVVSNQTMQSLPASATATVPF